MFMNILTCLRINGYSGRYIVCTFKINKCFFSILNITLSKYTVFKIWVVFISTLRVCCKKKTSKQTNIISSLLLHIIYVYNIY